MYKVICYFEDLQDNRHPYKVGDKFPRLGLSVSQVRLDELASANNKRGKALIKMVKEVEQVTKEENEQATLTKTDINRMSTSDLRDMASDQGIENADEYTGSELKKMLIERLGL